MQCDVMKITVTQKTYFVKEIHAGYVCHIPVPESEHSCMVTCLSLGQSIPLSTSRLQFNARDMSRSVCACDMPTLENMNASKRVYDSWKSLSIYGSDSSYRKHLSRYRRQHHFMSKTNIRHGQGGANSSGVDNKQRRAYNSREIN